MKRKLEKFAQGILLLTIIICLLFGCKQLVEKDKGISQDYTIAAYVWPSCHDEPMSREKLWGEGIGEWEIIKKGTKRFEGHYQPRIPLWGFRMDDDPRAWEQKIEAATGHGVNTFIFDWYWFDGKPFLEEAVNKGFLGASNNEKMSFYLMWANHNAGNGWNNYRYKNDTVIWSGEIDLDNFKIIVDRLINQYFKKPNYFKINNEPVFSIYRIANLVKSFNGLEATKEALDYFRGEVKKAGFPGLHIQVVGRGKNEPVLLDKYRELEKGKSVNEIISLFGINSITTYNWMGTGVYEDYIRWAEKALSMQNKWDSILTIPYFPNVSVGRDASPRYPYKLKEGIVRYNNSPESFGAYLQKAKEYADNHPDQPKLITVYAWNEWVEGSYLEPDMKWGFGYLEAVRKVMRRELGSGIPEKLIFKIKI